MPVMDKHSYSNLVAEMDRRWARLSDLMQSRELVSPTEGAGVKRGMRWSWKHPEDKCATVGSGIEIRMAVEDFRTVLAEIKKLK